MATRNDVTGDVIASRGNSNAYKDNWDAIFGKKAVAEVPVKLAVEPEMQTIYYIISDSGDGSASVQFFRNPELAQELVAEDESYYMNEGCIRSFKVPAGETNIFFSDADYATWKPVEDDAE